MRWFRSVLQARALLTSAPGRFAGMSPRDLSRVLRAGRPVRFHPGGAIAVQSGPADGAYILLAGEADVSRDGALIGTLGPGDIVGEIALLQGSRRTASVLATNEVQALHIEPEVAAQLLRDMPSFRHALELAARQRLARDKEQG